MIALIVITHGHFGEELLRTAQEIVGRQEFTAGLSVTHETGIETLSQGVDEVLERFQKVDGFLFMVDMLGGTPCNTVMLKGRNLPTEVVTGVNLYMLISAFTHRGEMDLKALAAKVAEDGRRAIVLPKDLLSKRMS